jgi:hypothetical protein
LARQEDQARALIPQLTRLAEDLGNPTITASTRLSVGEALALLGSSAEAIDLLELGLPDAEAGGPITLSDTRSLYALLVDDPQKAARILRPALAVARDQLSGYHQLPPIVSAAKILVRAGRGPHAARLLGVYRHHLQDSDTLANVLLFAATGPGHQAGHQPDHLGPFLPGRDLSGSATWIAWSYAPLIEQLGATMGDDALEKELRRGEKLSPVEALQLAEAALAEWA